MGDVGETPKVQLIPLCVTVTVCPATVSVPTRCAVDVFAVALKVTVPFPLPLAPPLTLSQPALLVAVQAHPGPAVTPVVEVPAAAGQRACRGRHRKRAGRRELKRVRPRRARRASGADGGHGGLCTRCPATETPRGSRRAGPGWCRSPGVSVCRRAALERVAPRRPGRTRARSGRRPRRRSAPRNGCSMPGTPPTSGSPPAARRSGVGAARMVSVTDKIDRTSTRDRGTESWVVRHRGTCSAGSGPVVEAALLRSNCARSPLVATVELDRTRHRIVKA